MSRDQFLHTIRPEKESRRRGSEEVRVVAMRSVMEKREVGDVVDVKSVSRTCEPVGESASERTGDWSVEGEEVGDGGGKRRKLMSLRRKGVLVGDGARADCMMCVVVW